MKFQGLKRKESVGNAKSNFQVDEGNKAILTINKVTKLCSKLNIYLIFNLKPILKASPFGLVVFVYFFV